MMSEGGITGIKIDLDTSGLKPLTEEAAKLLASLCGPAFKEIGAAWGASAAVWRLEKAVKLSRRIDELRDGLEPEDIRSLPPGLAIRVLDDATLEDAEEITELWAKLIANATDHRKDVSVRKAFVQALRGMEPLDAKILKLLHNQGWLEFANVPDGGFNAEKIASILGERKTAVAISLGNLFGLGCVVTDVRSSQIGLDLIPGGASLNPRIFYRLSSLGTALLCACER